jgi:chromate reductase, NAD(P)H dehydrogenase (quinone)
MDKIKVGVLVGSLRRHSYSRQLAVTLQTLAPNSLELEFIELGDLAMYNQDLDDAGNPPPAWVRLRETTSGLAAVLFVTPEYNRSIPGVLKNAIDVGSRPVGHSVWNGKPCAVVSVSTGMLGAFGANHHLRQSLATLNMPIMPQPEVYISNVRTLYDQDGNLINDKTREFLQIIMNAFEKWIHTILEAR